MILTGCKIEGEIRCVWNGVISKGARDKGLYLFDLDEDIELRENEIFSFVLSARIKKGTFGQILYSVIIPIVEFQKIR